jgi:hypothetical protein
MSLTLSLAIAAGRDSYLVAAHLNAANIIQFPSPPLRFNVLHSELLKIRQKSSILAVALAP